MNFICSADQHLSIKKDLPLDWQLNRYRKLWNTYVDLCHYNKAELVLAGDLAHNARVNLYEAQLMLELFHLLEDNEITTHIIAGNHENMGAAGTTLDYFHATFDSLAYVDYYPQHNTINRFRGGGMYELSFVGHNQLQEWMSSSPPRVAHHPRIIFSHFRPTVNQFIKEEIDVHKFLATGDMVFAGDIHLPFDYSRKLIYTNAPLNCHFEPSPKCGLLLVTLDAGKVDWKRLDLTLPNLVQLDTTAEDLAKRVLPDNENYYRIEVTGTPEQLRNVELGDSVNGKMLKIPEVTDTYTETEEKEETLDQSLEESLIAYMQELEYEEELIQQLIAVYREA